MILTTTKHNSSLRCTRNTGTSSGSSPVVETERRFYLANHVDLKAHNDAGDVYFELTLRDAWVWDSYRTARFIKTVHVLTFKDVNIEEIAKSDLEPPTAIRG